MRTSSNSLWRFVRDAKSKEDKLALIYRRSAYKFDTVRQQLSLPLRHLFTYMMRTSQHLTSIFYINLIPLGNK